MEVTWEKIRWAGSKARGTRTAIAEYIRKKGDDFNTEELLRLSRDWEKPLVEDTAVKLKRIKKQWSHVNKALQQIRLAQRSR